MIKLKLPFVSRQALYRPWRAAGAVRKPQTCSFTVGWDQYGEPNTHTDRWKQTRWAARPERSIAHVSDGGVDPLIERKTSN